MKRLNKDIFDTLKDIGMGEDQVRIVARTHQVHDRYAAVIRNVYKDSAQIFLDHTNSVYITDRNEIKVLIVYMDESIYAAELNAQRELIRLQLLQMFGEGVDSFEIHVSRGSYKKKHPFISDGEERAKEGKTVIQATKIELSEEQKGFIENTVSRIGNTLLQQRIREAMTADLQRADSINEKSVSK